MALPAPGLGLASGEGNPPARHRHLGLFVANICPLECAPDGSPLVSKELSRYALREDARAIDAPTGTLLLYRAAGTPMRARYEEFSWVLGEFRGRTRQSLEIDLFSPGLGYGSLGDLHSRLVSLLRQGSRLIVQEEPRLLRMVMDASSYVPVRAGNAYSRDRLAELGYLLGNG